MFRMRHIGMTKQQATDSKLIANTNTQNQGLPQMMMMLLIMLMAYSGITFVLHSFITVLRTGRAVFNTLLLSELM